MAKKIRGRAGHRIGKVKVSLDFKTILSYIIRPFFKNKQAKEKEKKTAVKTGDRVSREIKLWVDHFN